MRTVWKGLTLATLTCSLSAQQPSTLPKLFIAASDVGKLIADAKSQLKPNQTLVALPLLQLSPVVAYVEYRVGAANAAVHETDAEFFYVLDGSGTLVTGGTLLDQKRVNPANLTGTGISGGTPRQIERGDFTLVPENTPHAFTPVGGSLTLMSLRVPHKANPASAQ